MANETASKYWVLLFEHAWKELGEALEPYQQEGPIGKYLYCQDLNCDGYFVKMTFTAEQVDNRIDCVMHISIPNSFVKFIAEAADSDRPPIGFRKDVFARKL